MQTVLKARLNKVFIYPEQLLASKEETEKNLYFGRSIFYNMLYVEFSGRLDDMSLDTSNVFVFIHMTYRSS